MGNGVRSAKKWRYIYFRRYMLRKKYEILLLYSLFDVSHQYIFSLLLSPLPLKSVNDVANANKTWQWEVRWVFFVVAVRCWIKHDLEGYVFSEFFSWLLSTAIQFLFRSHSCLPFFFSYILINWIINFVENLSTPRRQQNRIEQQPLLSILVIYFPDLVHDAFIRDWICPTSNFPPKTMISKLNWVTAVPHKRQ